MRTYYWIYMVQRSLRLKCHSLLNTAQIKYFISWINDDRILRCRSASICSNALKRLVVVPLIRTYIRKTIPCLLNPKPDYRHRCLTPNISTLKCREDTTTFNHMKYFLCLLLGCRFNLKYDIIHIDFSLTFFSGSWCDTKSIITSHWNRCLQINAMW